jgi:hypothetical protein
MKGTDQISRMLAAERAAAPPSGSVDAGLQRLLTSLAGNVAPLPVATGSLKVGWSLVGKWIGLGLVVGVTAAGSMSLATSEQARDRPAARATVSAPARIVRVEEKETSVQPPAQATPEPATVRAAPSRVVASRLATSVEHGPSFDEELRLIAAAKRELDAGRPHLSRIWLDEHATRFPRGVFELERAGLLALARCAEAPSAALARDFAARYPESPLREQVVRRCEALPAPSASPVPSIFPRPTNE